MDPADVALEVTAIAGWLAGKEGDAESEDTGKTACDLVAVIVSLRGEEEEGDATQASYEEVARVGVVVGADGRLQTGALGKPFAEGKNKWESESNDSDYFA